MKFYVCCPGNTVEGPISSERIRAWRRDGQINATTLVSKSYDGGWVRLGQVPELIQDSAEDFREQAAVETARSPGQRDRIPVATAAYHRAPEKELTGFQWHTRMRAWLSGLAVLASCFGEYIPIPGGSVFASMAAFLWSAESPYHATPFAPPIDLQPYAHWIPIYLAIGLGFWLLFEALQVRYSNRMPQWACVAIGFLLLDMTMTTVISGFVIIPGVVSPPWLLLVGGLLVGSYRMNFDGLRYFYRFQRNAKRHEHEIARLRPDSPVAPPPPTAPPNPMDHRPSTQPGTGDLPPTQSPEAGVPRA